MKKEIVDKTIRNITKALKKDKNILGFWIGGSYAKGNFDKFSDVDTTIALDKKILLKDMLPKFKDLISEEEYKHYQKVANGEFPYRIDPKINGVKFTFFFSEYSWYVNQLNESNNITVYSLDKHLFNVNLKRSKIKFDKPKVLSKKLRKIKDYPKNLRDEFLSERLHKLNYLLFLDGGAIQISNKRKNLVECNFLINEAIINMLEVVYALNNKFLIDRKWVHKELPKLRKQPKSFFKKISKITLEENLEKKIKMARKVFLDLMKLTNSEEVKNLPDIK
jgi:predicted nucleotidyltransferase